MTSVVIFSFQIFLLTFCDRVDCSPPGSSIHGILQARILKWVAISFSILSIRTTLRSVCFTQRTLPSASSLPGIMCCPTSQPQCLAKCLAHRKHSLNTCCRMNEWMKMNGQHILTACHITSPDSWAFWNNRIQLFSNLSLDFFTLWNEDPVCMVTSIVVYHIRN